MNAAARSRTIAAFAVALFASLLGVLPTPFGAPGSTVAAQPADAGGRDVVSSMTALPQWPEDERADQIRLERRLNAVPDPDRLRAWHDLLASEPHHAGSRGDARTIDRLVEAFESMGLRVTKHEIWPYLAQPLDASVAIVSPVQMELPLRERELAEDPFTGHPELTIGFNAFSGSGEAAGRVVYANYGRLEDFETLERLGVDLEGAIVIARYGGNYRGYKAKFAQEAGAAGVLIYSDPRNSGYMRGLPYPEGGWNNETSIQRGSIITLAQPGDPLTPFIPAVKDADRLDPEAVALPRIPVQPIGWGAAREIMSRMAGRALPRELVGDWQGGLPFAYRLEGGPDLRVRVAVRQSRQITRTANVIAELPGARFPEEKIILGCHHDAWGFGAGDPLAGLIVLMETARSFAELAKDGFTPDRTIVFACWGAEEMGIIGSTEWVEAHREDLAKNAVAYINLDMSAMGPNFWASSAPALKQLIADASLSVPNAGTNGEKTIREAWTDGREREPRMGNLGGGSDHIGLYCHIGVPCLAIGGGGGPGVSYHSSYDTLAWYRMVVGDDYEPALMLARMANTLAVRLADAPLIPLDPLRYVRDAREHMKSLGDRAEALDVGVDLTPLEDALQAYDDAISEPWGRLLQSVEAGRVSDRQLESINAVLLTMERNWIDEEGLPGRPWFRNLYVANNPNSGYGAWMLPALRQAIEDRDAVAATKAVERCVEAVNRLTADADRINRLVVPAIYD